MKAVLDHIGIAVQDLPAALAFYRDALGLEVEAPEDVPSQRVRAHFIAVGQSNLELLEATANDSPIAKYIERRGPGLHHITLRVDDVYAAVAQLRQRGVRMIDETPRPGAEHSMIAFVHPSAAHGVLIELKQTGIAPGTSAPGTSAPGTKAPGTAAPSTSTQHPAPSTQHPRVQRFSFGALELITVCDGFIRFDGGAMFGIVPKPLWSKRASADERNRITLAMRSLIVRGTRTMIIDAGLGDKQDAKFHDIYGVDRRRNLDHMLAEAGLATEDIDIVLATHLHFDHAGGFTTRAADGTIKPKFPRAQYVVRRGEWEDANNTNERNRASYLPDNFLPLERAGVLQLVDEDQTIMPGVRVWRTGGHTMHHQIVLIESGNQTAAFAADLMPTTAHAADAWIMGYDLYPRDTLAAKQRFVKEAIAKNMLVFFQHDPVIAAGYLRERDGKRFVESAETAKNTL
jgi:methylmalonyl-CoA epimerase